MTFKDTLIKWKGKRTLKEAADELGVPYPSFVNWAVRGKEPSPLSQETILNRMKAKPNSNQ